MPLPQFDIPTFVRLWSPVNYRKPKFLAAIQSFLYGLTWNMAKFVAYKDGDPQLPWSNSATYNAGNGVVHNFKTYESLIDGNTGNQPDTTSGYWTLRCDSFIGADERVHYAGNYLSLTYALNRYFSQQLTDNGFIGFRQPPYPAPYDYGLGGGTFSDIYITNIAPAYVSFAISEASQDLGRIATVSLYAGIAEDSIIGAATSYGYTIHIPVAVFDALGATDPIRESVVRQFVDRHNVAGTFYEIDTY